MPNSRSQPSSGSSVSSTPVPVPMISIAVLPATVSSAVSKPRTELALVSWIAITTAMPSETPSTVVMVRIFSLMSGRRMNCRNNFMWSNLPDAFGKPPVLHPQHARRRGGDIGGVRRQQHGDAQLPVELGDQRQHVGAVLGIEIAGRFVGDEQRRLMDQRAGDRGALHFAAGDLLRVVRQPMRDADALGERPRAAFRLLVLHAREQAGQRDVVADRQRRQQVEELEDEADLLAAHPRQLVVAHRRQIAIVERQRAARRAIHRAAQVQQRRLAAARRPHQRDEVAGLDLERHAGERGHPRFTGDVGFLEVVGSEQGHVYPY